ncbi:MAG: zinc ribbon domain-containing protein [Bacteroidota bacterium]
MICSACGNDNPRTSLECINCGNKMNVVRCKCGFLNSLMDSFCGSCGKQLIKSTLLARLQRLEVNSNPIANFSEQELMRIVEIQQTTMHDEQTPNSVSQNDIDKLFE